MHSDSGEMHSDEMHSDEMDTPAIELPLDENDFERVTLVDLPTLARYGRFELLGRLAYGGMAEIFLAREIGHENTRRMMVIKRVLPHVAEDPHFVDMFVDEARLAMQLNHPSICHVYSFGEAEGTYFIAMEWVNGKPLSQIIRRAKENGGLPIPIALKIIAQVAEALDYAHRAADASGEPLGVVHRDVSPQNIMVSYDGVVKLLDFGIAKATSHSTRTEAGIIKGKFAYMSPQQCVGEPIDARADVFALGICLFEALTGKNPFRRKTEFETMTRIVGDATPKARERREEIPEPIEGVVGKALMKQPERRFQTAGEMQMALEEVIPTLGAFVSAGRIGEYVTNLFADEVRDGPHLDMRITAPPKEVEKSGTTDDSLEKPLPAPPGATDLERDAMRPAMATTTTTAKPSSARGLGLLALGGVLVLLLGLVGAGGALAWVLLARPFDGSSLADPGMRTTSEPTHATPPSTPVGEVPPVGSPAGDGTTQAAAPSGTAFFESVPSGATISFGDREAVGTTPLEVGMIPPGAYDVRLELDRHRAWEGQFSVTAGQRVTITARLDPERAAPAAAPPGEISINTRPWSRVYVGRRLLGTTPIGGAEVPSGNVRLRLVDRDGNEHTRTVRVPPGEHVTQSFDLTE
jgi:serine/threonine-protein kinase